MSMAEADVRIVIVGCGMSGVAAAQRLVESGFKQVRIVEATGRSGGRILTQTLGERSCRAVGSPLKASGFLFKIQK